MDNTNNDQANEQTNESDVTEQPAKGEQVGEVEQTGDAGETATETAGE